ncbi:MAG: hypothetical protein J5812_05520, partial [Candidatus Methanomethylophilaceae archaeon]|nr:hypothetical protein [Candidatus Methanomethylophilaceae archaeon]
MGILNGPMDRAADALASIESGREETIKLSRAIIRLSKNAIHAMHTGEDPSEDIDAMSKKIDAL